MTIYNFGTSVDPSVFVEIVPDTGPTQPAETDAPQRPARGTVLKARDAVSKTALADIILEDNGYWSMQTQDIPLIEVSADNFQSYTRVRAAEAMDTAATAGIDTRTALDNSAEALDVANQAIQIAQNASGAVESVNGQTGSVILTASDVGARPTGTLIPTTDVSGLSTVATTGVYSDLSGKPAAAIPLTDKGAANGVATLDATGKVPTGQLPTSGTGGAVDSVNGKTGVVVLNNTDVGAAAAVHGHVTADVTGLDTALSAKAPTASPTFTGTVGGITKSMVGLANVDNTSDLNKPVSTATQTSLNGKASTVHTHVVADVAALQDSLDDKLDNDLAIGLLNLPAGGTFAIIWDSTTSSWKYGGSTVTTRPSPRADITAHFIGGTSTNPPNFGIVGVDLWFKQVGV